MKHLILLSFLAIFTFSAQGQCTPDTTLLGRDIYYAPAGSKSYNVNGKNIIVLPYAQANQSYSEVIQFKVPKDTVVSTFQADIEYIKLVNIQNLPGNLAMNCNPANCTFPGGTSGCAQISGTAGAPDSLMLLVSIEYKFESNGNLITVQDTLRNIYLVTKGGAVGISRTASRTFAPRFYPNPARQQGTLSFYLDKPEITEVKITNVIGNRVFYKKWEATSGDNKLNLVLSDMPSGVYVYSVRSGSKAHSGRFLISQ